MNLINVNNPGVAAVTRTLTSVPTGIVVEALINVYLSNVAATSAPNVLISPLSISDQTPSSPVSSTTLSAANAGNTGNPSANISVFTNTSAQVRSRLNGSDASVTLLLISLGWIDTRGKNN